MLWGAGWIPGGGTLPAFAARVLPVLLTASLQASIIVLGTGIVVRLSRRRSAAVQHLLWSTTLVGVLTAPLIGRYAPGWRLPNVPGVSSSVRTDRSPAAPVGGRAVELGGVASALPRVPVPHSAPHTTTVPFAPAAWQFLVRDVGGIAPASRTPTLLGQWLVAIWLAGVLVMLARLLTGLLGVWDLARSATPVADMWWGLSAHHLAARLRVRRPVALLTSDRCQVPLTWGLVRPVVLIPASALGWNDARRTTALMHELAHVSRCDALTRRLAQVATTVFWFNPLVRMAAHRALAECERACDDIVLTSGVHPVRYADQLLEIARTVKPGVALPRTSFAMARLAGLEERLVAILDSAVDRRRLRPRGAAMVIAVSACVTAPAVALKPPVPAVTPVPPAPATHRAAPRVSLPTLTPVPDGRAAASALKQQHLQVLQGFAKATAVLQKTPRDRAGKKATLATCTGGEGDVVHVVIPPSGGIDINTCQTGTPQPDGRRPHPPTEETERMMRTLCSTLGICSALAMVPLSSHAQQADAGPLQQIIQQLIDGQGKQASVEIRNAPSGQPPQVLVDGDLSDEQKSRFKAQIEENIRHDSLASPASIMKALGAFMSSPDGEQREATSAGRGKTVVVLDGTPAGEETLHDFAQALRAGKVRIRKDGMRTVPGDTPEGVKYGAGRNDTVILIQSEPVREPTK